MLLFGKLVNETQMGNPRDHAIRDIASKFSIFLPLRAIHFRSYHYETPCMIIELQQSGEMHWSPRTSMQFGVNYRLGWRSPRILICTIFVFHKFQCKNSLSFALLFTFYQNSKIIKSTKNPSI